VLLVILVSSDEFHSAHAGTFSVSFFFFFFFNFICYTPNKGFMSCDKKRVLVTGASGLLGRAVVRIFSQSEVWEVQGIALTRAKGPILGVDLLDDGATTKIVETFKPDVIVHTAAERRIEVCESDPRSRELNVEATRRLARLAKKHGAWLLFVSTDYLFDGKAPPYREGDVLNPLNEYGLQKRDAGIAAREEDW
jgi:dTDP-4-dehydrorhamnose reductase